MPFKHLGDGNGFFLKVEFLRLSARQGSQLTQLGRRSRVQLRPMSGGHRRKGLFRSLIKAFGVNMEGTRCDRGRAAFTSQTQGLGPEGGILAPAFGGGRAVLHDTRKIKPYSGQNYPTTSCLLPLS